MPLTASDALTGIARDTWTAAGSACSRFGVRWSGEIGMTIGVGIATGRPPPVSGRDGRAAVEIVEAADRAGTTGESVRLPLGA